jgi:hypothetical protein
MTTVTRSNRIFFFLLATASWFVGVSPASAFQSIRHGPVSRKVGSDECRRFYLQAKSTATLTEDTIWNLRMVLQNLPTANGKTTDQIFAIRVKFVEEIDYEPPQGYLVQVVEGTDDGYGASGKTSLGPQMRIVSSRWQLSEDPNDRRDSLWVWGLFKEPLYPFLLLQMEIDEIPLPGEVKDSIKPFKLFAQINHARENGEVILSSGADLTIKEKETIKADPFGAATVDIFEDVAVGKLQIQAVSNKLTAS